MIPVVLIHFVFFIISDHYLLHMPLALWQQWCANVSFKKTVLGLRKCRFCFCCVACWTGFCADEPVSLKPTVLTGQKPLYSELNGKCGHCCRKHIFLHFPLIFLPSQEALTWVVHQFKRVDSFLTRFLFSFLPQRTAIVTYWVSQKWKIFMQACNTCNEVLAWPSTWLIL